MFKRTTIGLALVLAGFVFGLVLTGRLGPTSEGQAGPAQPKRAPAASPTAAAEPMAPLVAGLPDFSDVASRAVTGIVNISAISVVRTSNSPFANDPIFRQFFGNQEEWFGSRLEQAASLGSGVIISPDGYVVTNNHVVAGNVREITAGLPGRRDVKGHIVGRDPMTDIAVVKIDAKNLPVLPWGDSSKLKVGQWVLAIGSPYQLNQTVTLGIVSALGRTGMGLADYEDFIQTDAAINRGNSGGGLIDARGQVVGINTAIISETGGSQGVGFAVSSNLARRVADELIKYGQVRRGTLGAVTVQTVTPDIAEQLGYTTPVRGAVVVGMTRTSSAYQAGIQPGDVIVSYNGQRIESSEAFIKLLADTKIGATATIEVLREGRRLTRKVPVTGRNGTAR
jgi:Do/DeqQ family serine protease